MSKDELDQALDSEKAQQSDKPQKRKQKHDFVLCYSPAGPPPYDWDSLPGKYVCPRCGDSFGSDSKGRIRYGGLVGDFRISQHTFDCIDYALKSIKKAGHDAELDLHCHKCIREEVVVPAVFRFRMRDGGGFIVSYPDMDVGYYRLASKGREPPGKVFEAWLYRAAASFLTYLGEEREGAALEASYQKWLDELCKKDSWKRERQTDIRKAVEGILGLSLNGPQE